MYSNYNQTETSNLLTWLHKLPKQTIDVTNIVYNYHVATHELCDPAIVLLWEPAKLIQCETKYRLSLLNNLTALKEYNTFDKEISEPFQQKAINLMTTMKVRISYLYLNYGSHLQKIYIMPPLLI